MAIAFKCDRCGKFEENKKGVKNFIKKEYRISFPIYFVNNFFGWKVRGIDVCQDCFESFEKWMESEQSERTAFKALKAEEFNNKKEGDQ